MAKKIRDAMAAWEEAGRLRSFATALEQATASGGVSPDIAKEWAAFARGLADRVDPLLSEKPVELRTCDYMPFEEWYAELLAILGKEHGFKSYSAQRVYAERRTPEEAAEEVDWDSWYW